MRINRIARLLLCIAALARVAGAAEGDEPGFRSIFNGKDLQGWDGRPGFWTVKDGHIRGESTREKKAPGNTFLIWRGGKLKNFELKLKYRILTGNNSGVQYRSREVGKWVISGYQAEVQNRTGKTGFLYHEKGRGWLVDVGDFMEIGPDGAKAVVGVCADQTSIIKAPYHVDNEWNEYHIICRGNHVVHVLNGYQTVELIDHHVDKKNPDSVKQRCMEGVLALQIHGGGAMTVDYKDVRIKNLTEKYGEARRLFNGLDLATWDAAAAGGWIVKVLLDADAAKAKRRAKLASPLTVIACKGGGKGDLSKGKGIGDSYVLRYQRRIGKSAGSTPHKSVLGWETIEVTVSGDKSEVTVGGAVAAGEKTPCTAGRVALPSGPAAEYRNVVLIPIE